MSADTTPGLDAERAPAPAPPSDWDLRGMLAARLSCWHRLTGSESDELVALARSWGAPAASGEPVARKPLTEQQVDKLATVGPVYAPDGIVSRRPQEYRRELESALRRGVRAGEAAHGIKP